MSVELKDDSIKVKAALNDATVRNFYMRPMLYNLKLSKTLRLIQGN